MIGVFDSGLGGLSVWREIVRVTPDEPIVYLADQAHVPYGSRGLEEVRRLTERAVGWLLERRCDVVVLACHTASAAALHALRHYHPEARFVGMEPAIKPAALHTHTGAIGVLATRTTFQGEMYASVVARFASRVQVIQQPCSGWVELVESGCVSRDPAEGGCRGEAYGRVCECVHPLLDAGADTLVLGCTHFPFLEPLILLAVEEWRSERRNAREVEIIDPSQAVARQVAHVLLQAAGSSAHPSAHPSAAASAPGAPAAHEFWTTGDPERFAAVARQLLPELRGTSASRLVLAEPALMNSQHRAVQQIVIPLVPDSSPHDVDSR